MLRPNTSKGFMDILSSNTENKYFKKQYGSYYELFDIVKKHKIEQSEFESLWWTKYGKHRIQAEEYDKKPIREHKDNKDYYNGSGGSNVNKVRYPAKCRKTAWKRFYKLFPKLNPENKCNQ
jgi:hypothetical protein